MNSQEAFDDEPTIQASFQPLAESYPRLCVLSTLIGWSIALVVMLATEYWLDKVILPWFLLPVFALVALLSLTFSYYSAKVCAYQHGDFDLMFKSGLWWKKKTAVSFSRIQHIDLSHGPLERKFGLASLKFFTAGGISSDLKIPGLPKADAEQIREEILKYTEAEYQSANGE